MRGNQIISRRAGIYLKTQKRRSLPRLGFFYPKLESLEDRVQPGETFFSGFWGFGLLGLDSSVAERWTESESSLRESQRKSGELQATDSSLSMTSLFSSEYRRENPPEERETSLVPGRWMDGGNAGGEAANDFLTLETALKVPNRPVGSLSYFGQKPVPAFTMEAGMEPVESRNPSTLQSQTLFGAERAEPDAGTLAGLAVFSGMATPISGNLFFDPSSGAVVIRGQAADNTVRESITEDGFLEVGIDGRQYSSNPGSASFDRDLMGATESTLTGIRYENGGGHDTLTIGSQTITGSFMVSAPGAEVITQDIGAGGQLGIEAESITVSGALYGREIGLSASGLISVETEGGLVARDGDNGGRIDANADIFVTTGRLHADGANAGQVFVHARNILNAGQITADGEHGAVGISFTGSYIDTTAALNSANGGHLTISGGSTGRLYSSGRHEATGAVGGTIDLLGRAVVLNGATVDASGENGGGLIRVGGDFHGQNAEIANAQTVIITGATMIRANATGSGSGGRVAIWSDGQTDFSGSIAAHGGPMNGDGGLIEVSGKGNLNYGGSADAGAHLGESGTLMLDPKNINISEAPDGVFPQFDLIDPHPTQSGFGTNVIALDSGNIVVTNPNDDFGAAQAGAAYLFDGLTGALISSLVGSNSRDQVGYVLYPSGIQGITLLNTGNYLIGSVNWNSKRGAVTWASGHTGVSGVLSEANSLVGSTANDYVGYGVYGYDGATPLANGNYLVKSPYWNARRGAVTLGNGATGIRGTVSAANSLVGSASGDEVGNDGITLLGNGNYVVRSHYWNGYRGAVTWGDGHTGVHGVVSEANSLVGSDPNEGVGIYSPTLLTNGNYVVNNPYWAGQRGAVTWGDGTTGVHGTISEANSLVGTNPFDQVGWWISPLANGNYVVQSRYWKSSRGAATWGDGLMGVRGPVSEGNSVIGSDPNDGVGGAVIPLTNGNYVVSSTSWRGNRGAVTWGDGLTGTSGIVSEDNSLVGNDPGDFVGDVTRLANGNYVVRSQNWNSRRGAVTWGDGSSGVRGQVSEANSLVGTHPNDFVGYDMPISLRNGNYVIDSPDWNSNRGAVTWGDGTTGVRGPVSEDNSLIGANALDHIGQDGITLLNNDNYVVGSSIWNGARGAATWSDGRTGVRGFITETNSLIGTNAYDRVGAGVTPLSNGNYVVRSVNWSNNRGAATWGNGSTGVVGTVTDANSLVGSNAGDGVGRAVTELNNGNYVVRSSNWMGNRGAATWGDGSRGVAGAVSEANSLVGTNPDDNVSGSGVIPLSDGNYLVHCRSWNNIRGALTWGDAATGTRGAVSEANSLVGSNRGDMVGQGVHQLSDGNYVAHSPGWNTNRGAVTWVNGTTGQTLDGAGVITPQNSILGQATNAYLGRVALDPVNHSFAAPFSADGSGRVAIGVADPNQFTFARGQAQTVTLTPELLTATLNTGTAVTLQASNDITIEDPITVNAGGKGGALTLQAGRSIILNASISTDNGPLTLIANDTLANGVVDSQRDPGNAFISMVGRTTIDTGSGPLDIELRNGAGRTYTSSRSINLQTISAGSVNVVNNGPSTGSDVVVGPVTSAGAQTYSSPNGTTVVTGNLTAVDSPIRFTDSVVVDDRIFIDAGADKIRFNSAGTQNLQTGSDDSFGNVEHSGTGTLQLAGPLSITGSLTNSAGIFDANDEPVTVSGLATLTAGTYRAGTAPQNFLGGLIISGGTFTSSTGPMSVNGPVAITGGSLAGEGMVGAVTVVAGNLIPGGSSPGILTVAGSVTLFSGSTFTVRINGSEPGGSYSQLVAEGPVFLGGSTLNLVLGFEPPVGSSFEIVQGTGPDPISGTFAGLDEGAVFEQGGLQFQITYQGGTGGHNVVVTRVK